MKFPSLMAAVASSSCPSLKNIFTVILSVKSVRSKIMSLFPLRSSRFSARITLPRITTSPISPSMSWIFTASPSKSRPKRTSGFSDFRYGILPSEPFRKPPENPPFPFSPKVFFVNPPPFPFCPPPAGFPVWFPPPFPTASVFCLAVPKPADVFVPEPLFPLAAFPISAPDLPPEAPEPAAL